MSIVRTGLFSDFTDSGSGFTTGASNATVQAGDGSGLTLWVVVQAEANSIQAGNITLAAAAFPGSGGAGLTLVERKQAEGSTQNCWLFRLDDPNTDPDPQSISITFGGFSQRPDGYTIGYILTDGDTELRGYDLTFVGSALEVSDVVEDDIAIAVVSRSDDGAGGPAITNTSGQTTLHNIDASTLDDYYTSRLTTRTAASGTHTETFTFSSPAGGAYNEGALLVFALGEAGDPPATAPTPGTITPTVDGASIVAPTLPEDADGVEYEIDDSDTWVDVEDDDPIVITGQDPNTQYDIRFRFYNSIGAGPESDPETYTTLNGVQSVQIIERTETSVHVRVTTNTTGWLSVGLLPEDDTPSLAQLVAGFTSEGEPNYQYGWIGGSGGQVEITEAGTFDVEVGDWTNPDNGGSVPNPLDENTAYRVAAALFTTVSNSATNIGNMVFADIPAFGEGGPVISRPSVFGITSSGARVRVQLGDYNLSATGSIGAGTTEVSEATVSGTMYLSIVPDPTGDPEDWPDGDEIIAETGAVYADSQAVATSYIPLFFGLGVGGPQEYGGLLIDFAGITGLTPGTDYVASLVQRDAGVNSTPVYFPFSTEPRFSAHIKEGFANGSGTAHSGPFKLTGDDLAFAALVQFEHPEMGYDGPGGGSTPTSTIPDGEGDGFYLGVHDPGTDISETAEFYRPTWYYGGEGQGLIEDGEVAFTLRTGVTGGDNIEVFVGSSGGGSTDYDGIQSDSNVVLALAMRGVKGAYHQQVSDDSVWNTIQESPFTISRTVLARPGDSVLAIVLVNVGPGAGEGNGLDTGLTLTPISGVDEVLPQWSNIAVSGSSYLNTANSIHVAVCSRDATGEPDENGFVEVDVGWDLAESADDYPGNGPGYRLITFVVSGEPVEYEAAGSMEASAHQMEGAAVRIVDAAGTLQSAEHQLNGAAPRLVDAVGVLGAAEHQLNGAALREVFAEGLLVAEQHQIDGEAAQIGTQVGNGSLVAAPHQMTGAAVREVLAAGSLVAASHEVFGAASQLLFVEAVGTLNAPAHSIVGAAERTNLDASGVLEAAAHQMTGDVVRMVKAADQLVAPQAQMAGAAMRIVLCSGNLRPRRHRMDSGILPQRGEGMSVVQSAVRGPVFEPPFSAGW